MSYVGQFELFAIINIWNGGFSLCHNTIVHDVVGQQADLYCLVWFGLWFWFVVFKSFVRANVYAFDYGSGSTVVCVFCVLVVFVCLCIINQVDRFV